MKKTIYAIAMASTILAALPVYAEELWDPHLRGVDEGLAAGALPPPGVYGVLDNYWATYKYNNNSGKVVGAAGTLNALVEVPIVLWVPGIKILGADYAAAIAEPFDYTSMGKLSGYSGGGNWGTFNTVLVPAILSWTLGDFHVSTGLTAYLPTASSKMPKMPTNGGLPSGNNYTAIQPDFGVSWLKDGWNLSAGLHLAIPVDSSTNTGYTYHSGNQFSADYTATKTVGKWTFGVGAHQENQLNSDKKNGINIGSKAQNFGAGPLVGYQFSNVNVMFEWNHNIQAKNDVAGDFVNIRLLTAF